MMTRKQQAGLTLVEVLVAVMLLLIILVPAMEAIRTSVTGAQVHSELASSQFRLTSRMEELLAEPFTALEDAATAAGSASIETSYSETAGSPGRLVVYLSPYDGDNADADDDPFTGTDPGLLWIEVKAEGTVHSLRTVRAQGF